MTVAILIVDVFNQILIINPLKNFNLFVFDLNFNIDDPLIWIAGTSYLSGLYFGFYCHAHIGTTYIGAVCIALFLAMFTTRDKSRLTSINSDTIPSSSMSHTNPLQSTTPPSSKYYTNPLQSSTPPSSKYHITSNNSNTIPSSSMSNTALINSTVGRCCDNGEDDVDVDADITMLRQQSMCAPFYKSLCYFLEVFVLFFWGLVLLFRGLCATFYRSLCYFLEVFVLLFIGLCAIF